MATQALPAGVSTLIFDVGNTLHHLDYDLIAATVSRHSHAVGGTDVRSAELVAKRAVDAAFRARAAGSDSVRQVTYLETILEALQVPAAAAAQVAAELRAENARTSLWRVVEPDTAGVLAELRQRGFTLGVVSNADGRVAAGLEASGLASSFAVIVDSHVVGVEKPDRRIFAHALQACAATASASVYVGDIYEIDVRGARNAGMTPVLLDPLDGYHGADCLRVRSLADILSLLPAGVA